MDQAVHHGEKFLQEDMAEDRDAAVTKAQVENEFEEEHLGDEYRSRFLHDLTPEELTAAETKRATIAARDPQLGEVYSTALLPPVQSSLVNYGVRRVFFPSIRDRVVISESLCGLIFNSH